MGILKNTSNNNILIDNGFKREYKSPMGDLKFCYTKFIEISNIYGAYVSVDLYGGVEIYVEYICGGKITTLKYHLSTKWIVDEEGFFEELDEVVTKFLETFK